MMHSKASSCQHNFNSAKPRPNEQRNAECRPPPTNKFIVWAPEKTKSSDFRTSLYFNHVLPLVGPSKSSPVVAGSAEQTIRPWSFCFDYETIKFVMSMHFLVSLVCRNAKVRENTLGGNSKVSYSDSSRHVAMLDRYCRFYWA